MELSLIHILNLFNRTQTVLEEDGQYQTYDVGIEMCIRDRPIAPWPRS